MMGGIAGSANDPLHGLRLSERVTFGVGRALPLGAHDCCDGVNFSVFSRHAERLGLLLFDAVDAVLPTLVVPLDPKMHRTGDVWHVLVTGIGWGQAYAWRAEGPWAPEQGHRFDARVPLVDPNALALAGSPRGGSDPAASTSGWRSIVVDGRFDWQDVTPPRHRWSETVIYELHVRGLTRHPSSKARHPGSFLGVIEKIPYLESLGITAVELMPVQEFDSGAGPLGNYWGYNPVAFRAPKESYGSRAAPGSQVIEFKTMVRELHRAGIEVILDLVFNHTAEGGADGPTIGFRGLDNHIYYLLDDRGGYRDFTGCGNTVNCGHPVVRDHIIDCLRHWAGEMRVDGFRFDLASVLGRGADGQLLDEPPLLERIAEDPLLRDKKLIAEAWDAGGAFQLGRFPGRRWAEWNCHFRDDVRRFWRGDEGMRGALASRLCGSADIYQRGGRAPICSLNFVTCHDGFTLNDLVSYRQKHNEANGEDNRDGPAEEFSENHGVEGPTDDPEIERLRQRQIRNMLATLLLSRGVPMILGGDEFRRTQDGNSNAYCQDNETSWYDWRLAERHADLVSFVRELIGLRRRHSALRAETFYSDADLIWFDRDGAPPVWDAPGRTFGVVIHPETAGADDHAASLCLLFNAGDQAAEFVLPALPDADWRRALDTGRQMPVDLTGSGEPLEDSSGYDLEPKALALLVAASRGKLGVAP